MPSALIASAAILVGVSSSPTVKMSITLGGKNVGTAWITEKLTEDGGKRSQTKLILANNGLKSTFIDEVEYDKEGYPVRKYVRRQGPDGQEMRIATFGDRLAEVVTEMNGKRSTQTVKAPEGCETRAASEFWFIKNQPRVGQTDVYYRFDMDQLAWIETKVKYEGMRDLELGGQIMRTHCVTLAGMAKTWLNDLGRPLKVEAGKLVLVKSD